MIGYLKRVTTLRIEYLNCRKETVPTNTLTKLNDNPSSDDNVPNSNEMPEKLQSSITSSNRNNKQILSNNSNHSKTTITAAFAATPKFTVTRPSEDDSDGCVDDHSDTSDDCVGDGEQTKPTTTIVQQSTTTKHSNFKVPRSLLPASILNFLPPSPSASTIHNQPTSSDRNRRKPTTTTMNGTEQNNNLSSILINDNQQTQQSLPRDTFCPTIASALWRPLWPPGWHPRSSSTSSTSMVGTSAAVADPSLIGNDLSNSSSAPDNENYHQSMANATTKNVNMNKCNVHKMKTSGAGGEHLVNGDNSCPNNNNNNYINRKFDIFTKEDYEKIEDWLDEHPEFIQSYVVRKVPRSVIDKWLLTHSSSTILTPGGGAGNSFQISSTTAVSNQQQNNNFTSNENSGANTPVRKISAHEFEASGGGYLRPMVSTTCNGTLTFLPVQDVLDNSSAKSDETIQIRNGQTGMCNASSVSGMGDGRMGSLREALNRSSKNDQQQQNLDLQCDAQQQQQQQQQQHRSHRPSIISMKSREELESIKDEKELIFELVKDICNDLDVKSLCHKILKNVSILTNADRCSLFLVRGEKSDPKSRYLVSQLFDVCGQSTIEQVSQNQEFSIPWGTGIVGHVAESGIAVNIPDCYQDSRFTDTIDLKTGYKTKNMLCNPIFDFNGEVMGVAQVINKINANSFDRKDENVFGKYLQFCGIGLRNAQIYERSQLENRRNQVLLDLARMVFEKQSNIENIIYRILIHILSLLQCERCQIMLLPDDSDDSDDLFFFGRSYRDGFNELEQSQLQHSIVAPSIGPNIDSTTSECTSSNASTTSEPSSAFYDLTVNKPSCSTIANRTRSFNRVFDLQASDLQQPDFEKIQQTPFEGRFPINIGITGYVATTGETLNISDPYNDSRFDADVDRQQENEFRHKSILCMPIRNATRKIIGVAQLVNKLNGRPFNKNDENLFEAFAIFSGMGIENTNMFEKAVKAMAKQKVTLELLSYHASATEQEASKFARMLIPSTSSLSLSSLRFDDFSLNEDQMIKACLRMFIDLDLIERFHIDYKVLCKWILSVRKNYRPVLYHNWRHAFNVAQMMFAIFVNTNMCLVLGELETLALIVACLCHDLDHRGTNNSFQIKTSSPLAQLYSTSTLEHHHFDQSLMILNSQGNQIFGNLSPEEYRRVVYVLEDAILATDLAIYFKKREQFFELIDKKFYDWSNETHRSLLRSMLMTCCDIAAITKPWETQKVVAELVASEFYQQGDIEKEQLNIQPSDMMNREKRDALPKMQISFIDSICMPIYESFAQLCPQQMKTLLNGVVENREAWNLLSNQPYEINLRQAGDNVCNNNNQQHQNDNFFD